MQLILFVFFLVLSAFFSGSETAFFSLSKVKLQHLKESGIPAALRVVKLMEEPRELLITILIGNTLANVAASTIAALITAGISVRFGFSENLVIILEIIVVVAFLLVLGEITPKIISVKNATNFSQRVSLVMYFIKYLFYPATFILAKFSTSISQLLGIKEIGIFFSEDELKTLLEVSEEKGTIEEDEREMLHSIFEFSQTTVREIMVPRIDMVCVEKKSSLDALINLIKVNGYSRIPLFQDRIDNIIGIIHAKDLLPYIKPAKDSLEWQPIDLSSLARQVVFVPENKKIDELLREFQRDKIHMAIVVDEYGGTDGLITLEDILEEIVGEIQDEYDIEGPLIKKIDDSNYLVDAKINIYELQEVLQIPILIHEGYDTLAGLIFDHTGYVPKEKERIKFDNFDFIIEKVERSRILTVRIH
ncbi:HlyC/CorC family transporter, partial [candidate division KSB1 bacterium]|nr:HlyC/CorC family transporter [candidate division KSB1 bacterium]